MHGGTFAVGCSVLALAWTMSPRVFASWPFSSHMTTHMAVVAIAAPLLALSVAGRRFDPSTAAPALFAPIPASFVELILVWGWHMPALHAAARTHTPAFLAEQTTFLAAGLLLWVAAIGGNRNGSTGRAAAGIVALVFTSMHMTLLGALFALAPRPLYAHSPDPVGALLDQQTGGVIMLLVGGVAYLAGGLWLTARVLRERPSMAERAM